MAKNRGNGVARLAGTGFAYVQHSIDRVVEWGFASMQNAGQKSQTAEKGNLYMRKAKRAGRTALGFLGTLGSTYYEKYEELKQRHPK